MRISHTVIILFIIQSFGNSQSSTSVELQPNLFWVQSVVDDIPNYLLVNPILQFNLKIKKHIEPYVRFGKAFVSGDDVTTANFTETGAGIRLHVIDLLSIKGDWASRRLALFLFTDYSLTNYSLDDDLQPIPTPFGNGSILRIGGGTTIRCGRRFSIGLDYSYQRRKATEVNPGNVGGIRLGYHFHALPSKDRR